MNSGIKVWLHLVFVLGGFQLIPIKTNRHDDHNQYWLEKQKNLKQAIEIKMFVGTIVEMNYFSAFVFLSCVASRTSLDF